MAGNSITRVEGKGVYVPGNDIDTDRIIPARFLKCVTFDELGANLMADERFDVEGNSKNHVLDDPRRQGAAILISDANFGCGSSREHAPQAIAKFGLKAVIAESFAEIFHGNSTTLGIPCLAMAEQDRHRLTDLIEADPEIDVVIDLERLQVTCANNVFPVTMKDSAREAFLSANYDPLDVLLEGMDSVAAVAARLA